MFLELNSLSQTVHKVEETYIIKPLTFTWGIAFPIYHFDYFKIYIKYALNLLKFKTNDHQ